MPGPSTDSQTQQTRGAATPTESAFSGISLQQALTSLGAANQAVQDPRQRLSSIDAEIASIQDQLSKAKDIAAGGSPLGFNDVPQVFGKKGSERWAAAVAQANTERQNLAKQQLITLSDQLSKLQAEKLTLPAAAQEYESQQQLNRSIRQRLDDFVSGKDLGVSPQEQALITQGISGISQDVATTRGLNRSDVPVMQAVAPTVANALLQQANANRALFTGINQFQQGLDLSNRQLQVGLAGQNPAANLTGVFSGLRSSDFATSGRQNYGSLDFINTGANLARGIGSMAAGFGGGGGGSVNLAGIG